MTAPSHQHHAESLRRTESRLQTCCVRPNLMLMTHRVDLSWTPATYSLSILLLRSLAPLQNSLLMTRGLLQLHPDALTSLLSRFLLVLPSESRIRYAIGCSEDLLAAARLCSATAVGLGAFGDAIDVLGRNLNAATGARSVVGCWADRGLAARWLFHRRVRRRSAGGY